MVSLISNQYSFFCLLICFVFILFPIPSNSECPNACSLNGRCGANDACICFQNFMGGDCSQRMCQFGISHIDQPLGDLDSSLTITGPSNIIIKGDQRYPNGVTERYPNMINSDGEILTNTAHPYAECSNRGLCLRDEGVCECLSGYEGSACQYISCPSTNGNLCSGHGVCLSLLELAAQDNNNVYELWDKKNSRACKCDPGYFGSSCEYRKCKSGYDILYSNVEGSSFRYSNWTFGIYISSPTNSIEGNYSITFYDSVDEDWVTNSIDYDASCLTIIHELEKLPNNVIPLGSVQCLKFNTLLATVQTPLSKRDDPINTLPLIYGIKYTLAFPQNPGKLKQLSININLDGNRPTLQSTELGISSLKTYIHPNGFTGEINEYFSHHCIGVDVSIIPTDAFDYLGDITAFEFRLLQKCLGEADRNSNKHSDSQRVEGIDYSWDYGTIYNPHMIRLVDRTVTKVTDLCNNTFSVQYTRDGTNRCESQINERQPGFFVPLYYNYQKSKFILFTKPSVDYDQNTLFTVFTTTGTLQMVSPNVKVVTDSDNRYTKILTTMNSSDTIKDDTFIGQVDCETTGSNIYGAYDCLEKEDYIFIFDPFLNQFSNTANPTYINLYTVKKIYQDRHIGNGAGRILLDMSINAHYSNDGLDQARLYKFTKPSNHLDYYPYATECSNRGNCDRYYGYCKCYVGFEGDACVSMEASEV